MQLLENARSSTRSVHKILNPNLLSVVSCDSRQIRFGSQTQISAQDMTNGVLPGVVRAPSGLLGSPPQVPQAPRPASVRCFVAPCSVPLPCAFWRSVPGSVERIRVELLTGGTTLCS